MVLMRNDGLIRLVFIDHKIQMVVDFLVEWEICLVVCLVVSKMGNKGSKTNKEEPMAGEQLVTVMDTIIINNHVNHLKDHRR